MSVDPVSVSYFGCQKLRRQSGENKTYAFRDDDFRASTRDDALARGGREDVNPLREGRGGEGEDGEDGLHGCRMRVQGQSMGSNYLRICGEERGVG